MSGILGQLGIQRRTVSPIGLDIGPGFVRAAQLERDGDIWKIARVGSWRIRESDSRSTPGAETVRRVRSGLRQMEYRGRRTVAGLSLPDLEIHALEIPIKGMEGGRRNAKYVDAARWELQRVMSIPPGEGVVDFWTVPSSETSRTTSIGVAAASKQIDTMVALADAIGLDCERIDATACALARLGGVLGLGGDVDPRSIWGVLDIGQRLARVVVCTESTPLLARSLGDGSESWTRSIALSLGVSAEAAETHKQEFGIEPDGDGDESAAEVARMIQDILRSDLDAIAVEVERSYEYVMRCFPDRKAAGVLLVGGGASMKGLDRFLTRTLGVDVQTLDDRVHAGSSRLVPPEAIRASSSLSEYGCAIGLSIEADA